MEHEKNFRKCYKAIDTTTADLNQTINYNKLDFVGRIDQVDSFFSEQGETLFK